jgi:hypothetical protein
MRVEAMMIKLNKIIFSFKAISLTITLILAKLAIAGQYTGVANSDTVDFGNYTSIRTTVFDSATNQMNQQMSINYKSLPILILQSKSLYLADFCYCYKHDLSNCYATDLNADGYLEIGILELSDDSDGHGNKFALYTMKNDTAVLDNDFITGISMVSFDDLNGDSIPELIFADSYFYYLNLAEPPLVWQWQSNKYKQANFNFPGYLLLGIGDWKPYELEIDESDSNFVYNSKDWLSTPQLGVISSIMLNYIYAGRSADADSLLDSHWPGDISGKRKFRNDLWEIILADPYWLQVSQSKW